MFTKPVLSPDSVSEAVKKIIEEDNKKTQQEGWDDMMKAVKDREKEKGTDSFEKKKVSTGTVYNRKPPKQSDKEVKEENIEEESEYTHEVYHKKTGEVVGRAKSKVRANSIRDKKDNAYGGYVHGVREIPKNVKEETLEETPETKPRKKFFGAPPEGSHAHDKMTGKYKELNKKFGDPNKKPVKEESIEEDKWIQKAIKKPGALHKQLGVPADKDIPEKELEKASHASGKLGKRARLAMTLKGMHEEKHGDEKEDKALVKKMVRKDCLKNEEALEEGLPYRGVGGHREREDDEGHGSYKAKETHTIHINGRPWKSHPDKNEANRIASNVQKKYPNKTVSVHKTYMGEETEQIDEISKATAKSYLDKKLTTKPQSKGDAHRSFKGIARADERLSGRTPTSEEVNESERSEYAANIGLQRKDNNKVKHVLKHSSGRVLSSHDTEPQAMKAFKDLKDTRGVKIVKEEQIDELNKDTIHSYVNKANKDYEKQSSILHKAMTAKKPSDAEVHGANVAAHKMDRRNIGAERAEKRLNKEETLDERELTSKETAEKERLVHKMKPSLKGFKQRYGDRAKEVMYATATKMAKKD